MSVDLMDTSSPPYREATLTVDLDDDCPTECAHEKVLYHTLHASEQAYQPSKASTLAIFRRPQARVTKRAHNFSYRISSPVLGMISVKMLNARIDGYHSSRYFHW